MQTLSTLLLFPEDLSGATCGSFFSFSLQQSEQPLNPEIFPSFSGVIQPKITFFPLFLCKAISIAMRCPFSGPGRSRRRRVLLSLSFLQDVASTSMPTDDPAPRRSHSFLFLFFPEHIPSPASFFFPLPETQKYKALVGMFVWPAPASSSSRASKARERKPGSCFPPFALAAAVKIFGAGVSPSSVFEHRPNSSRLLPFSPCGKRRASWRDMPPFAARFTPP